MQDVFNVDVADESQQALFSVKPSSLMSIFEVYLRTKSAVSQKKVS
jgi:small glutamine-rich tetratricopeptide repeat-containing protein alpha